MLCKSVFKAVDFLFAILLERNLCVQCVKHLFNHNCNIGQFLYDVVKSIDTATLVMAGSYNQFATFFLQNFHLVFHTVCVNGILQYCLLFFGCHNIHSFFVFVFVIVIVD